MTKEVELTTREGMAQIVVRRPEGGGGQYYILPEKVKEQLMARQALRKVVEDYWSQQGWGLPPIPLDRNLAILPRQVATARFEDLYFNFLCERECLEPCWLELTGDVFTSKSTYKVELLAPYLFSGRGRNGGPKLKKEVLTKGPAWEGRPLKTIMTNKDQRLIDWHHEFRKHFFNGQLRLDISDWLLARGGASQYYFAYLSLFVAHGICFDLLHGGESGSKLEKLCNKAFNPAWEKIMEVFACPPLIYPLPWDDVFAYYPDPAANKW